MLFNSISFGIFLIIVFLLYYIVPHKYRWGFLLLASYAFYMNLHLWYGILLFLTTLLTYGLALSLEGARSDGQKRGKLLLGVLPLVLILVFFKTANPVIQKLNEMVDAGRLSIQPLTLTILLPAGISFYFFQSMAWGYFKKLVIADTFAITVNKLFNNVHSYVGLAFIVVTVMFAIEIYCDFSGYSDIAVGCARMFGIRLMTNFKSPYFSFSIKEFWSRWHISLSTWFRDYVYIPLGGNRVAKWRHMVNLLLTFLVSGFWHGASLTYIVWGGIHGLLQVIETLIYPKGKTRKKHFWQLPLTFVVLCFTWIFFRANSMEDALWVISRLFWDASRPLNYLKTAVICLDMSYFQLVAMWIPVLLLGIYDYLSLKFDVIKEFSRLKCFIRWPIYVLLLVCIALFSPKGVSTEFIYFQF